MPRQNDHNTHFNFYEILMPSASNHRATAIRILVFLLTVWSVSLPLYAQMATSIVPISETYSSNGKFKLKSVSYDNDFPTMIGESEVFENNHGENGKLLYKINRSFDLYKNHPYFLAVSNDGRKLIYIIDQTYFGGDENKNITLYQDGKFVRAYTEKEFTGCDDKKEKCGLLFRSTRIYDHSRSSATIKAYKNEVGEKEMFLEDNYIFNHNDTIYLTDSRRKVTIFDLHNMQIIRNNLDFDSIYSKFRGIERIESQISNYRYSYKYIQDFENHQTTRKISNELSNLLGLKYVSIDDPSFFKIKSYRLKVTGYLNREGSFKVETLSCDSILDQKKIELYFKNNKFKADFLPREVDKQYFKYFFGGFRSFDDKIAELETKKEEERRKSEFNKRLTLDSINRIYIPKNLHVCFVQLDSILTFDSKKAL